MARLRDVDKGRYRRMKGIFMKDRLFKSFSGPALLKFKLYVQKLLKGSIE